LVWHQILDLDKRKLLTRAVAWMIAACLPLPVKPIMNMQERDHSTSNLESGNDISNDYAHEFGPVDEARYESAKWWRRLNRWMSLVGILIIVVIVSFSTGFVGTVL